MNNGKFFETAIKASVPAYCLYYRLPDPPQSFHHSSSLRFSWKNPCDVFLFNSKTSKLFTIELKTTKSKSISYESPNSPDKQPIRMIHKHQIQALTDFAKYKNIISGFLFNFRDESALVERTYFQHIEDFSRMTQLLSKHSFNESDLLKYNPVIIPGRKKRVHYAWDLEPLLQLE